MRFSRRPRFLTSIVTTLLIQTFTVAHVYADDNFHQRVGGTDKANTFLSFLQKSWDDTTGLDSYLGINYGKIDNNGDGKYDLPTTDNGGIVSFQSDANGNSVNTTNTNQQLFRVGSVTKTFTASVLLRMIDSGDFDISLDTTLGELQDTYGSKLNLGSGDLTGDQKSITISQLMNMSSLIGDYLGENIPGTDVSVGSAWGKNPNTTPGNLTISDFLTLAFAADKASVTPGFTASYSNSGAIILAEIAKTVADNNNFNALLKEYIFAKTGLNDTVFPTTVEPGTSTVASKYVIGHDSGEEILVIDPTVPGAAGAIVSTINDQTVWLGHLTQNWDKFLSEGTFNLRLSDTSTLPMNGVPLSYGYNIFTTGIPYAGKFIGHAGNTEGYSTFMAWSTILDIGFVANLPYQYTFNDYGYFNSSGAASPLIYYLNQATRIHLSDGTYKYAPDGSTFSYGKNGGYLISDIDDLTSNNTITLNSDDSLSIQSTNTPIFYLNPTYYTFVMSVDPTFTYYGENTAVTLNDSTTVKIEADARVEAYGTNTKVFVLNDSSTLELKSGGALNSTFETGIYGFGESATAVEINDGTFTMEPGTSLAVEGTNVTGVISNGGVSNISGSITVDGSGTGISASTSDSVLTLTETGQITAKAPGYSIDKKNLAIDPRKNGVTGIFLEKTKASNINILGTVRATSDNPWDGSNSVIGNYYDTTEVVYDSSNSHGEVGTLAVGVEFLDNAGGTIIGSSSTIFSTGYGVWASGDNTTVIVEDGASIFGGLAAIKGNYDTSTAIQTSTVTIDNSTITGAITNISDLDIDNSTLNYTLNDNASLIQNIESLTISDSVFSITSDTIITSTSTLLTENITTASYNNLLAKTNSLALDLTFNVNSSDDLVLQITRDSQYHENLYDNTSLGTVFDTIIAQKNAGGLTSVIQSIESGNNENIDSLEPILANSVALNTVLKENDIIQALTPNYRLYPGDNHFTWELMHSTTNRSNAGGDTSSDLSGFTLGYGYKGSDIFTYGVFLNYTNSNTDFSNSSSAVDNKNHRVGLYMLMDFPLLSVDINGSYGHHDISQKRDVLQTTETYVSDYSTEDVLFGLSAHKDFAITDSLKIAPFFEGVYLHMFSDSYVEQGGDVALTVSDIGGDIFTTTLGIRLSKSWKKEDDTNFFTLNAGLGWLHLFDGSNTLKSSFNSHSNLYFYSDLAEDDDILQGELGAVANLNENVSFDIGVNGYLGEATESGASISGRFKLLF